MIVVAIIGILATLALPAYQEYSVRAKMSEVLAGVANCKMYITESAQFGIPNLSRAYEHEERTGDPMPLAIALGELGNVECGNKTQYIHSINIASQTMSIYVLVSARIGMKPMKRSRQTGNDAVATTLILKPFIIKNGKETPIDNYLLSKGGLQIAGWKCGVGYIDKDVDLKYFPSICRQYVDYHDSQNM